MTGEADEEAVPGDENVPDTDCLLLLLQRNAGGIQEASAVDPVLVNPWEGLKVEVTRALIKILNTIEKVLDLGLEALIYRDDLQQRLMSKEGRAATDAKACEMLKVKLRDTKLKLETMADWKRRVTDADEKAAAALLQAAVVKSDLSKVAQKRNESAGRFRVVKAESGHWLIRLNTLFVQQARVDAVLGDVIEPYVFVFDGFVNPVRGELVNSFRDGLEKAYSFNLVEYSVVLMQASGLVLP